MWRKVHGQSHVESQAAFVHRHHRRVLLILTSQDGDDCSPDRVYHRMERRLVVREARMSNVQRKGHFGAKMEEACCAQDKKAAAAAALDLRRDFISIVSRSPKSALLTPILRAASMA